MGNRSHVGTIGEGYMGIILLFLQLFRVSEIISKQTVLKFNKFNF